MQTLLMITGIIGAVITVMTFYQIIYAIIGFFKVKKYPDAKLDHEYGIMIAARNESNVIAQLIESIRNCDYDQSKIRVFVIADNCTDNTAEVARNAGATVFERFNQEQVGKGYALDYLLSKIHESEPDYLPEAWMIFDADNLLDKNYIKEMNKAFDAGEEVVTSLRNGKNFNTNWVSAVGCMAFMRECRFSHAPRTVLGVSTNVTGTGWLVKNNLLNYETGFPWHLILEDNQFTMETILKDHKVGYQDTAIFYDEQPTKMKVVYKQRMRWQTGGYANMKRYTGKVLAKMFKTGKFTYYDHLTTLLPFPAICVLLLLANTLAPIVSGIMMMCNGISIVSGLLYIIKSLLILFAGTYLGIFVYGVLLSIKDWKRMAATRKSKIIAAIMYPIFIIAIMPIPIIAVFKKSKWIPIPHEDGRSITELNSLLNDQQSNKK